MRPGVIHKAACLSKTDLTTELVKEFTELQGIVGGLARVQQLDPVCRKRRVLPLPTRYTITTSLSLRTIHSAIHEGAVLDWR